MNKREMADAEDEQTALLKKMRRVITPELMERFRLMDEIGRAMTHRKPPQYVSEYTDSNNA